MCAEIKPRSRRDRRRDCAEIAAVSAAALLGISRLHLSQAQPDVLYVPGTRNGSFDRVLRLLPHESRSFPTHARNPFMLMMEVEQVITSRRLIMRCVGDS